MHDIAKSIMRTLEDRAFKSQVIRHVKKYRSDFDNMTDCAENAAHVFMHDEWIDDETHWIWDIVADAFNDPEYGG